jgi:hypothetical protein
MFRHPRSNNSTAMRSALGASVRKDELLVMPEPGPGSREICERATSEKHVVGEPTLGESADSAGAKEQPTF